MTEENQKINPAFEKEIKAWALWNHYSATVQEAQKQYMDGLVELGLMEKVSGNSHYGPMSSMEMEDIARMANSRASSFPDSGYKGIASSCIPWIHSIGAMTYSGHEGIAYNSRASSFPDRIPCLAKELLGSAACQKLLKDALKDDKKK